MDYEDPIVEAQWCAERREDVRRYLRAENVAHGRIGDWPAWHLAPAVSVWAIESRERPGWVGYWTICGDLPTDYLPAVEIGHPRDALRAFVARWLRAAASMARGESPATFSIGDAADGPTLAPMLASRAEALAAMAADDELWIDV